MLGIVRLSWRDCRLILTTVLCIAACSSGSAEIFYGYWPACAVQMWTICHVLCCIFFFALMPISTWLFLEKEHIILYCHYSCNPATKRQSHWFDWSARVYPFSLHVHKCSRGRCIGRCKSFVTELLTSACRKRFYKFWLPQCLDIGSVWSTVVDVRPATLVATFFFFSNSLCACGSVCVF